MSGRRITITIGVLAITMLVVTMTTVTAMGQLEERYGWLPTEIRTLTKAVNFKESTEMLLPLIVKIRFYSGIVNATHGNTTTLRSLENGLIAKINEAGPDAFNTSEWVTIGIWEHIVARERQTAAAAPAPTEPTTMAKVLTQPEMLEKLRKELLRSGALVETPLS